MGQVSQHATSKTRRNEVADRDVFTSPVVDSLTYVMVTR